MTKHLTRQLGLLMLLIAVMAPALAGCSGRNTISFNNWNPWKEKSAAPVAKIICIWEASRGRDMNGSPARGVAGEISFITPNSSIPVKVDGDVEVYVFDNQGKREERTKPIHKFRFDSLSWNRHFIESGSVGPSYNVFIPYTRKVVHQVEVSLSVRFIPKTGRQSVISSIDRIILPGPMKTADSNPDVSIVTRQLVGKKTAVTTLNQNGVQNHVSSGTSHRSLMSSNPAMRSADLLEPQEELLPRNDRTPIQQISGDRRSTQSTQLNPRQPQNAEALLERYPDVRRLTNDYRQRTGHPVRENQSGPQDNRSPGQDRENHAVTPGRGFRLDENSTRHHPPRHTAPKRDPFQQMTDRPRQNDGLDDPTNRHPLSTAGFTTPPPERFDNRLDRSMTESLREQSHPLRHAMPQRQDENDGYNRPQFAVPQQQRFAKNGFNQPTASDLLDDPRSSRSPFGDGVAPANHRHSGAWSAQRHTDDTGYLPRVDERRAWSEE